MMKVVVDTVGASLVYLFAIYCWLKLDNKKINSKNGNLLIAWILMSVIGSLIVIFVPKTVKIFSVVIMLMIINYVFISKQFGKGVVGVIIFEMLIMLSELVLVIPIMFVTGYDASGIENSFLCSLIISVGTPLLIPLLLKLKFSELIYNALLKTFAQVKNHNLVIYFSTIIILASILMIVTYMQLPTIIELICSSFLIICFVLVIVKLINAQVKYKKINRKYETSITSLMEYEKIMNRYRVDNHENKNQLMTIRNMIKTNDKKAIDYIDKILQNKIKDNENIFNKTAKIPEGGLRATIYSKVCKMHDLNIKYTLDISRDIKTVDLINLSDDAVINVCKILGVFLDNAIEAVENLKKGYIIIEIYMDEDFLCIDITNNYEGKIDVDKLYEIGYTTKGEGHGYGLALVSEILKLDEGLTNQQVVTKDNFRQCLKIKIYEK